MHLRPHTGTRAATNPLSRCSMHAALVHPYKIQLPKSSYATAWGKEKGYLRALFDGMLAYETGFLDTKMAWTAVSFQQRVFLRFDVKAVGWPPEIVFRNPKYMSTEEIRLLIDLCESGQLHFAPASDDELAAAKQDVAHACPGVLFPAPLPDYGRCDIGTQRPCTDAEGNLQPRRYERNGPKSAKAVDEEEEAENAGEAVPRGPLPMMYKDHTWLAWSEGVWRVATAAEIEPHVHS
ncbi:hypothetical protein K466DRAFT_592470 [Polyporus arcularius HHB13444]|uniref:Uncharacterized protein n=1 Tax=Polyporus arcularius HHB13444 TaxID=1314778 RepID=A0A5C3NPL7_9APHY|nr:hypothetical protein K466DRAFT_592470 [Polyporus arcularius HHB13444]